MELVLIVGLSPFVLMAAVLVYKAVQRKRQSVEELEKFYERQAQDLARRIEAGEDISLNRPGLPGHNGIPGPAGVRDECGTRDLDGVRGRYDQS